MTDPDRPSSPPPQPLDYAGRPDAPPLTSRLAVASLVAAVLCSPCLLGPLLGLANKYLPEFIRPGARHDERVFCIALILATALPAAALVRIRFARPARRGTGLALLALAVVLVWWTLLLLVPADLPNPN